jgi:hypothetical protein
MSVVDLQTVATLGKRCTCCGLAFPTDCSREACGHLDLFFVQGKAKSMFARALLEELRAGASIPVK